MSTIANNVVAKLSVVFVAVAMLVTLATPAQAQTAEELQQMINDLLAQVASLQGQLGGSGSVSASGVCPYTWTRSLNVGASGMDVMKLQQFLNSDPDTRIAATGVGSAGQETEYYGSLTGAAVAKFQAKYRSDILSPLGLVNPTTYFGPSTMAKANALCSSAMPGDDTTGDDTTGDDDDDSSGELSGGEASLEEFEGRDGDDTDLEEGQEEAPVAEFEFDVEDGDIEINRVDLVFGATDDGDDETDPWDVFDEISLWVDGDKVAEMDASDEDEWSDDEPAVGLHTLRFTGVDSVFREGDTAEIVVGVSVQSSVDGTANGSTWTVAVDNEGIRGTDGEGIDQYTGEPDALANVGDMDEGVQFEIEEEGGEDELNVRTSSEDPDATTFAVEENTKSDWFTVLAFNLDSDDSVNDIAVETIVVNVVLPSEAADTVNEVVNDAQLLIDGEVYDDYTQAGGGTATSTFTFDIDKELSIEAGDEVAAEFQLEFKAIGTNGANYNEGQTIQATTTSDDLVAEGADDLAADQMSGSATGEVHTLRSSGIVVEPGDAEESTQGDNDTTGIFELSFDVTAFENDLYIAENASSTADAPQGGVFFSVDGPGAVTSASGVLSSTADEDTAGVFTVREGETETFTMTVTVDPGTTGQHRVQLEEIYFTEDADGTSNLETYEAIPESDYRTGFININT